MEDVTGQYFKYIQFPQRIIVNTGHKAIIQENTCVRLVLQDETQCLCKLLAELYVQYSATWSE
jgi:hypothetical protein